MRLYAQRPDLATRNCRDCLKYAFRPYDFEKRKGGEPAAEDGSTYKRGCGKKRLRLGKPREFGDGLCQACPKFRGTDQPAIELDEDGVLEMRAALLCLRLGRLPSELDDEPWEELRTLLPYLESVDVLRIAGRGR